MKISEMLIIYFSAGAPVAVYYYFQNRARMTGGKIWFDTAVSFLFWIPTAARLFLKIESREKITSFKNNNETERRLEREKSLYAIQKRLEKLLRSSGVRCTVFEFRETLERYAGLTFALRVGEDDGSEDFFGAAQNKNPALAAKCFGRRNRRLLSFHQTSAREDFLSVVGSISDAGAFSREIGLAARAYAAVLEDFEAQKAVGEMFFAAPVKAKFSADENLEQDLWKRETQRRERQQRPRRQIIAN